MQAETTVSFIRDPSGNVLSAVAMVEDVTDRRLLEEQVQQMQRLESVGQLAGGVAHNFNNALTAIYGYSELLARRFDAADPALKDLEQIQRVAEQSASLTRQLLAFSRKEQVRLSRVQPQRCTVENDARPAQHRSSETTSGSASTSTESPARRLSTVTGPRWSKSSRIWFSTRATRCPDGGSADRS